MRQYLVVAHKTLGGAHLFEHLHELRDADPYCRFHFIVPETHPTDRPWTEGEVQREARQNLDEMLDTMAAMGMGATGEVGDSNPVYAVGVVMRREGQSAYAGIVVSTLPKATSLWWRFDVPERIRRAYPGVPVVHLVAEDALVS